VGGFSMDFIDKEATKTLDSIYYNLKENLYDSENYIDNIINNEDFRSLDDSSQIIFIERVREIILNKESEGVPEFQKRKKVRELIEKLEQDFKHRHIKKVPLYDLVEDNIIVKKNRMTGEWLNDSDVNLLAMFLDEKTGQSDKNFYISNVPFDNSKEGIEMFIKTFLKPLSDFRTNVQKNRSFGKEKFSSVLNIGYGHWVSLTLVPSINPNKAYAIYRDSFGKKMPNVLKQSLLKVYPEAVIECSNESIQKDGNTCGIYSVLASGGDKIISNSAIISSFMHRNQDFIADIDIKILEQAKNFSRENERAIARANSRKYSI
jgi:hypothetical protein